VDTTRNTLYFPYHVDTTDDDFSPITAFDTDKSLTGLVVANCQPILLQQEELMERARQNGVWGPVPLIWLGVPLMIKDKVIGVVTVQSYTNANLYTEKELDILSAVSHQMAIAIERKQTEDALVESEKNTGSYFSTPRPAFVKLTLTNINLLNSMMSCVNIQDTQRKN